MKSYLSLVPISAKVHKRQNRMTRICIILAVFLVTVIFSMLDMWIRLETEDLINRHGNYHIILRDVPADTAALIREEEDVAASSWYSELNPDGDLPYFVNEKKTVLYGAEESYITHIRNFPFEGSFPETSDEVMLSARAKELLGLHAGDSVTLSAPFGSFDFTVSGFCQDDDSFNDIIDGFCVYLNMDGFLKVGNQGGQTVDSAYYIRFGEHVNLRKAIQNLREQYGLTDQNVEENTVILGVAGASSNENISDFYPLAAFSFLLILISGVLMISSCINSSVAQRTRFFGMMRCIGASRKQIMRFVRLEALSWCKSAVPVGCFLGVVVNWLLCAILRLLIPEELANLPLFGVSLSGILCGAVMGLITVWISALSPARHAAKVSPMAAVSGNADTAGHVRHKASTRMFRIETVLGIHHAAASRKNLFLMTGSFAFTIILFFVFWAGFDFVRSLVPSLNSFTPDVGIVSADNTNSIEPEVLQEIRDVPGVETVFGNMFALETPAVINGADGIIDLISYDEYMLNWSESAIVSGDLSKVYGDSDYALTIFNKDSRLQTGDVLKIDDETLTIACVVSEGIWGDANATVVCSEETFRRLTGEQKYLLVNANFTKDADENTVNAIRSLAGDNSFTDRREDTSSIYRTYWVFRVAAYGFLAIISLITILNIMNSISMSVSARIRQYGAMRAVGMENRQITKMIAAEAATYALLGCIIGSVLGLILNYLLYERLVAAYFGGSWKIPVTPVVLILLIVLISCTAAIYTPAKRIRDMSVTDTINEL